MEPACPQLLKRVSLKMKLTGYPTGKPHIEIRELTPAGEVQGTPPANSRAEKLRSKRSSFPANSAVVCLFRLFIVPAKRFGARLYLLF